MQDDKRIIEQVLQGNKEAYAELIDRYQTKIFFILKKNARSLAKSPRKLAL